MARKAAAHERLHNQQHDAPGSSRCGEALRGVQCLSPPNLDTAQVCVLSERDRGPYAQANERVPAGYARQAAIAEHLVPNCRSEEGAKTANDTERYRLALSEQPSSEFDRCCDSAEASVTEWPTCVSH